MMLFDRAPPCCPAAFRQESKEKNRRKAEQAKKRKAEEAERQAAQDEPEDAAAAVPAADGAAGDAGKIYTARPPYTCLMALLALICLPDSAGGSLKTLLKHRSAMHSSSACM